MSGLYYDDPDDRPYGPGNPDYEYDDWRQRQDEEEQQDLSEENQQ